MDFAIYYESYQYKASLVSLQQGLEDEAYQASVYIYGLIYHNWDNAKGITIYHPLYLISI